MSKILVIDDDVVRETIGLILQDSGYLVVSAEDGHRGLNAFRSEKPDLVITDMIMPGGDATATIREIFAQEPAIKIIVMSGGGRIANTDLLKTAQQIGVREIIHKPFDPDNLLGCVSRCLGPLRES
jgi:DNA-binding NtrC family response regulator